MTLLFHHVISLATLWLRGECFHRCFYLFDCCMNYRILVRLPTRTMLMPLTRPTRTSPSKRPLSSSCQYLMCKHYFGIPRLKRIQRAKEILVLRMLSRNMSHRSMLIHTAIFSRGALLPSASYGVCLTSLPPWLRAFADVAHRPRLHPLSSFSPFCQSAAERPASGAFERDAGPAQISAESAPAGVQRQNQEIDVHELLPTENGVPRNVSSREDDAVSDEARRLSALWSGIIHNHEMIFSSSSVGLP